MGEHMERFKVLLIKHFEKILALIILLAAFLGMYFVQEKNLILNFYYLPVVFASYFLGKRLGVLTALLSILLVLVCVLVFPGRPFIKDDLWRGVFMLSSWGGFLILTSFAVGALYEQKERQMQDLKQAYIGILEILSKYIESSDSYTKGHSLRVSELGMKIAVAMDLPPRLVENIRVAGLLHDIGKIEVSSEVLRKAANLTPEEKELLDEHSDKGGYILAKVGEILKEVVPIVITHHKYFVDTLETAKDHLTKIPLGARIVAVADTFDAMTTDRPYRKGVQTWEAIQEIAGQSGKQFDPEVVEAFKRVISEKQDA
jgi:putative nucleotidyltransferase with HDIG domain